MFVVEATKDGRDHCVIDRDADVYLKWLVAGDPTSPKFSVSYTTGKCPVHHGARGRCGRRIRAALLRV